MPLPHWRTLDFPSVLSCNASCFALLDKRFFFRSHLASLIAVIQPSLFWGFSTSLLSVTAACCVLPLRRRGAHDFRLESCPPCQACSALCVSPLSFTCSLESSLNLLSLSTQQSSLHHSPLFDTTWPYIYFFKFFLSPLFSFSSF